MEARWLLSKDEESDEKIVDCLFTRLSSRAVRLEIAYGLDTDSFLRCSRVDFAFFEKMDEGVVSNVKSRQKWTKTRPDLKIGDVVLVIFPTV